MDVFSGQADDSLRQRGSRRLWGPALAVSLAALLGHPLVAGFPAWAEAAPGTDQTDHSGHAHATPGAAAEVGTAEAEPATLEEISYFFGFSFGNMLQQGGTREVDYAALQRGMEESLAGQVPGLTEERQRQIIAAIQNQQQEKQRNPAARMQAEARQHMIRNARQPGVQVTTSGLHYEVMRAGTGPSPEPADSVLVHYEGKLASGEVFDSSIARGEPAQFRLGQVITGWAEGLQLMKQGGKTRFTIPPDLGYGPGGTSNIPPHAVLIFEVELLEVLPAAPTPAG